MLLETTLDNTGDQLSKGSNDKDDAAHARASSTGSVEELGAGTVLREEPDSSEDSEVGQESITLVNEQLDP